jgi:ABC-type nickel/cobalt efflux system permease component RcnA
VNAYLARAAAALALIVLPVLAVAGHAVVAGDGAVVAVVAGFLLVVGVGGWWVWRPRRR